MGAYLGQLTTIERGQMAIKFGLNVGLLQFRLEESKESIENRISRLDAVEGAIRREFPIGTIQEPEAWFEGTINAFAATFPEGNDLMFFFTETPGDFLALVGSDYHIVGNRRAETADTSLSHQKSALDNLRWLESTRYDLIGRSDEALDFDLRSGIETLHNPWTEVLEQVARGFGQNPPQRISFLARRLVSETFEQRRFTLASPLYIANE